MELKEYARSVLSKEISSEFASKVDDIPEDGFLENLTGLAGEEIARRVLEAYEKDNVYEPREDSFLMQRCIKEYAHGRVLDMGTGSGVLAKEAAKYADEVEAVDINPFCIRQEHDKIKFYESDLFSNVKGKFDLIIFNPPYLPFDDDIKNEIAHALYGGKHGHETAVKFIDDACSHLKEGGRILLLFTTVADISEIEAAFERNMLEYCRVKSEKHFCEEMVVFLAERSGLRRSIEYGGFSDLRFFAQGKRGCVYKASYDGKDAAVKVKRGSSEAINRIQNEAYWLKRLNEHGLGSQLLGYGEGYVAYEFVHGEFIEDYVKKNAKGDVLRVLKDIMQQCRTLDKIGANKEEMHRPIKNIIIGERPVLIDFERCRIAKRPKNVTQFCQFCASALKRRLEEKGIILDESLLEMANEYKKDLAETSFEKIISVFD